MKVIWTKASKKNDNDFKLRKSILERLTEYHISLKDVIEITGIDNFSLEWINIDCDFEEYMDFYFYGFAVYFISNGDKELILWWI